VPPSGSNTTITEAGKCAANLLGNDAGCSWPLQIPVNLAPSILVDDIGERDAANRPINRPRFIPSPMGKTAYDWTRSRNPSAA
jgi:hypothetical protein